MNITGSYYSALHITNSGFNSVNFCLITLLLIIMNIYVCNEYSELDFISNTYIYTCIIYNEFFLNGQFL